MKKLLLLCGLCGIIGCSKVNAQTELKVLQWNIWQEGTMVPGGYEAIVSEIARLEPDFVTFSEVRNYHQTRFCDRIVTSLREKGKTYYSFYSYDSGLLSKHPITDSTTVFPEKNDHGSIYRMVASVNGQQIAVYTAHLDYLSDAYYNVRGYDGSTWKEIPIPETVQEVLAINDASQRDDAIREFVKAAKKDIAEGRMVILGGDFNEPSHLDWTRETKDLYDPGFTYASDNEKVPTQKLTLSPKSDERDRIDYIFYYPHPQQELKNAAIFGPQGSIVKNQREKETSKDPFIEP